MSGGARNDYVEFVRQYRLAHPRLTQKEAMIKASKSYQAEKKRQDREAGIKPKKTTTAKTKKVAKVKKGGEGPYYPQYRSSHIPIYDTYPPEGGMFTPKKGGMFTAKKGGARRVRGGVSIPATINLNGGAAKVFQGGAKEPGALAQLLRGLSINVN